MSTPTSLQEYFIFRSDTDDDLSKLKNEAVPDDVRKWLASTFASPDQVSLRNFVHKNAMRGNPVSISPTQTLY